MNDNIIIPIKVIDGERWLSLMSITPKAKIRAIRMDDKKRVQDEGKHHCFEINVEGNIRLKPRLWKI